MKQCSFAFSPAHNRWQVEISLPECRIEYKYIKHTQHGIKVLILFESFLMYLVGGEPEQMFYLHRWKHCTRRNFWDIVIIFSLMFWKIRCSLDNLSIQIFSKQCQLSIDCKTTELRMIADKLSKNCNKLRNTVSILLFVLLNLIVFRGNMFSPQREALNEETQSL